MVIRQPQVQLSEDIVLLIGLWRVAALVTSSGVRHDSGPSARFRGPAVEDGTGSVSRDLWL